MKSNLWQSALSLLCVAVLSACGGSKTVHIPPSELTEYPAQVSWQKNWSTSTGSGDGKMYVRLQPDLLPAMTQTTVFTADHKGTVMALDAQNKGKRLWRTRLKNAPITGGVGMGSGVVLVGTSQGEVIALQQSSGEEMWRMALSSEILAAPQAADGVVIALTEDSRVYAIEAATGEPMWHYEHTAPLLQLRGSAPVIIEDERVYAGFASGQVVVLDLYTGRIMGQATVSYPRGRTEIERMVDINGRMAVRDNVLYVVNYQGRAVAIDTRTQRTLWEKDLSSYVGLTVNNNTVFVTDEDSVIWALDRHTGDTLWQQDELSYRHLTAPTVFNTAIAVGDTEGYVHLLQASNGRLLGRTRAASKAIHAAPIATENDLYTLTSGGTLTSYTPIPLS